MFPLKDNIPTDRFPVVTVALIAINVIVFLFWQHPTGFSSVDEAKVIDFGAIPYELTHPGQHCVLVSATQIGCGEVKTSQPDTLLTIFSSMFMHGGFLHIAGNMLFLWIFGNNIEDSMGPVRFVAFYLLGGIAALAGQVLIDPNAAVPTIGASGAIAAVLGGYIRLYPHARVLTLIFIIFFVTLVELPAMLMLGLWFIQQLYFGAAGLSNPVGGGEGVAYWAHIGGFLFGLGLIRLFAKQVKDPEPPYPVY